MIVPDNTARARRLRGAARFINRGGDSTRAGTGVPGFALSEALSAPDDLDLRAMTPPDELLQ
jgi:hypothetical protein